MAAAEDSPAIPDFLAVFDDFLGAIRVPSLLLDEGLVVIRANDAFYQMFGGSAEQTEGTALADLGEAQWNIPQLHQLLATIIPANTTFNDFEVRTNFLALGKKIMHLNGRRISTHATPPFLILLTIADVTEREDRQREMEELVAARTVELNIAREEAEKSKQAAEDDLAEIKTLKHLLEAERAYLQEEIKLACNHEKIIGQSQGLKYVLYKVEQIAGSNTTVLVLGETGTGKELVARAIHSLSLRKNRALVKVNCAPQPANLIESELFGHEKGSFTGSMTRHLGRFEVANGATLFLDEIGELPLELQAKLLRVIQDGEFERVGSSHTIKVDTRIIAATNRNLEEEVRTGRFREDLWYRLNIFPITVPPLRERLDDIPQLVQHYVDKISKRMGKSIEYIPVTVMAALQAYHWPGNIRELENVLERAVINSTGPKLRLVDELKRPDRGDQTTSTQTMEAVEREHITRILEQTGWKVGGKDSAAEILGLERSTLRARMRKLNIQKP